MIHKTTYSMIGFTFIGLLIGLLALVVRPLPAQADSPLPPRETPMPSQPDKDKSDKSRPVGSHIELVAPGAPTGAWAVVQWHSSDGRSAGSWQNVAGWQGSVVDSSRWWVHPKDFKTGPFRWLVRSGSGGVEWGVSEPFMLPAGANKTVLVSVLANKGD